MKFTDLLTERDGVSLDIKRVFMIPVGILAPVGLQIVALFKGQDFLIKDFCEGFAVVIGALAMLMAGHMMVGGEGPSDPGADK